jgi:hypothetical protein
LNDNARVIAVQPSPRFSRVAVGQVMPLTSFCRWQEKQLPAAFAGRCRLCAEPEHAMYAVARLIAQAHATIFALRISGFRTPIETGATLRRAQYRRREAKVPEIEAMDREGARATKSGIHFIAGWRA